jgi:DGQHR domain-containing protein
MMTEPTELRVPAIEFRQGPGRTLYAFAVDGKVLSQFAAVSRVRRDSAADIHGYQRPQILAHVAAIRRYLESSDALMPNALVVAFDRRVTFEVYEGVEAETSYARSGTLVIPIDRAWEEHDKPGWIVDGQQRTAAIHAAALEMFPVCVTAFLTESEADQRSQFILVNSTKPLPKGLIYELLPTTEGPLPENLQRRRFPAYLLERLNLDADSPLRGMIATATSPEGVIKDNSVLKMLENSLGDGILRQLRVEPDDDESIAAGLDVLKNFWHAVQETFPSAWGLKAEDSRLTHGVGVVSMGFLMDAIAERYLTDALPTKGHFIADLAPLAELCHWTSGYWEFGPNLIRKWNELQNTTKEIRLVTNHLLYEYRRRVLEPASAEAALQRRLPLGVA